MLLNVTSLITGVTLSASDLVNIVETKNIMCATCVQLKKVIIEERI